MSLTSSLHLICPAQVFSSSHSHLLLQDIDLPFFDLKHVLHVPDFSSESALLLRQVLQLLGFLVQEGLFFLQTQTQSIYLQHNSQKHLRGSLHVV